MSDSDKNADATNFEQPKNPPPNARSRYEKKESGMEKQFAQRFSVGDLVQVSGGRGVNSTIYTIESMRDGQVTLQVQGGSKLETTTESKLRKFAQRFSVGDLVQVSEGRGVNSTIYTIESMRDGQVTLQVQGGSKLETTTESKLRKVS